MTRTAHLPDRRRPGHAFAYRRPTLEYLEDRLVLSTGQWVPGQFVAKLYTELLGRAPDQNGWVFAQNWFIHDGTTGCNADQLRRYARQIYDSSEYMTLYADPAANMLTVYRGILDREPDGTDNAMWQQKTGFFSWKYQLENNNTQLQLDAIIDAFFQSAEFTTGDHVHSIPALTTSICSMASYRSPYANSPPLAIRGVSGYLTAGLHGSEAELQDPLSAAATTANNTQMQQTVYLAQEAVIKLNMKLIVPKGVTLITYNFSPRAEHGSMPSSLMGRLVRDVGFPDVVVELQAGAVLESVWLDGGRTRDWGFLSGTTETLLTDRGDPGPFGGSGTTVIDNVILNSSGWTAFDLAGKIAPQPDGPPPACTNQVVQRNLITGYTGVHPMLGSFGQGDGISDDCENAHINANDVVDATDAAIVVFNEPTVTQRTDVSRSWILSAGNTASWGIIADPRTDSTRTDSTMTYDFSGTIVGGSTLADRNYLWTGLNAGFAISFGVGTRAGSGSNAATGRGATFMNNVTTGVPAVVVGDQFIRVQTTIWIAVSGMRYANVQNNTGYGIAHIDYSRHACPNTNDFVATVLSVPMTADMGTIQGPYLDQSIDGCNGG